MKQTVTAIAGAIILGGLFSGCAGVSAQYRPHTVGQVTPSKSVQGLKVLIEPEQEAVQIGEKLHFHTTIRNVSNRTYWVPREPRLIFVWTYPDGRRDNFLREFPDQTRFTPESAVRLPPGHQFTVRVPIETYYFNRPGVTEFQAMYMVEENTNPELGPVWNGLAFSNAYGILVRSGRAAVAGARKQPVVPRS